MRIYIVLIIFFTVSFLKAQSREDLINRQDQKKKVVKQIQKEIDDLQEQIDSIPGWNFKNQGTIGGSISGTSNWYSKDIPNSSVGNFGINIISTLTYIEPKVFWKSFANLNLSWVKVDDKDNDGDSSRYVVATDIFTVTSLFGYNLSNKLAVSALGEYRSSLINNFNDPGFLDLGVGITWHPIKEVFVVVHPLNYNEVFSKEDKTFISSMGAKIIANFAKSFGEFKIHSNLSIFQSYKSLHFSNYTWTNSFSYTFWQNIGIGLDFGLRRNKQESLNYALLTDPDATFESIDNELQAYWLIGLHYKIK